jgi:DNA polymerase
LFVPFPVGAQTRGCWKLPNWGGTNIPITTMTVIDCTAPISVHLDLETFSEQPIGSKDGVGSFRYTRDPSFEILMIGCAVGDEKPVVWVNPKLGIVASEEDQARGWEILAMLHDPRVLVYAHNAQFEIAAMEAGFRKATGLPPPKPTQYRCTMAMTRRAALRPALEDVATDLGLMQKKDTRGNALIKRFSEPQERKGKMYSPEEAAELRRANAMDILMSKSRKPKTYKVFRPRILPTDSPEDEAAFREYIEYNRQDVVVEREVHRKLKYFELTGDALATFQLDVAINMRGLPVNIRALQNAQRIIETVEGTIGVQFRELTGFNHTQRERVLEWLQQRGWRGLNMQAATINAALGQEGDDDEEEEQVSADAGDVSLEHCGPEVRQALQMKKWLSYAATKKIKTMLAMVGPDDNRIRGLLIYHGAGPGRWSAVKVQPQNFKRPSLDLVKRMDWKAAGFKDAGKALADLTAKAYAAIEAGADAWEIQTFYGPPLEVISSCIRHFIHDKHVCEQCGGLDSYGGGQPCWLCCGDHTVEHEMASADYSAIEARILPWLAGEEQALEEYRKNIDRYCKMASVIYNKPINKKDHEFPERFVGKQAILLLGYQGGGPKFRQTCEKYGYFDLPEKLEFQVVKAFREMHPAIVAFWKNMEKAARSAIMQPGTWFAASDKVKFICRKTAGMTYLFMRLPSGREIAYPKPLLEPCLRYNYKGKPYQIVNPTQEQIDKARHRVGESVKYGDGGFTLKSVITFYGQIEKKKIWGRVQTYGAKLVENATQGTAADIMANGAINAERHGYETASLIHDEFLGYYMPWKGQTIDDLVAKLTDLPPWADGLPLTAEGKIVPYYLK